MVILLARLIVIIKNNRESLAILKLTEPMVEPVFNDIIPRTRAQRVSRVALRCIQLRLASFPIGGDG